MSAFEGKADMTFCGGPLRPCFDSLGVFCGGVPVDELAYDLVACAGAPFSQFAQLVLRVLAAAVGANSRVDRNSHDRLRSVRE